MEIAVKVIGYPLPLHRMRDKHIWAHTANGIFTSKSAYSALCDDDFDRMDGNLNWLWKVLGPSRWIHFAWLVWKDKLLTNSLRHSWGIVSSPLCARSSHHVEDTLHVLRDCIKARKVWKHFIPSSLLNGFFIWDLEDWLLQNLHGSSCEFEGIAWRCLFITIIWRLWMNRCNAIFNTNDGGLVEHALVKFILKSAKQIHEAYSKERKEGNGSNLICWISPGNEALKLNTDGSLTGNPGIAGAGGLLRDEGGRWIIGFKAYLGVCSNMVAELQLLRWGLQIAWQQGFRRIICEIDAKVVIDLLRDADVKFHPLVH